MNKINRDNNWFNVLFGFNSKEKEEEYKYFYYLNIFKNTKNIILITSIIYFVFGVIDIFFNDINFLTIAIVKISVSLFGFTLVFTNLLEIKRINILVPMFYIGAMIGITVQVYYNTNTLFFTYYSAGLVSIMSIFLLMSGVNLVNSIISNTSIIIVYLYVLSTKLSIEYFLGHLTLITLGNLVAIVATYLNENSNRENYKLIKLIEQTNNDKLSSEIKQKQEILNQLQKLNEHNKKLQQNIDKLNIAHKQNKDNNAENKKLNSLIQSINKVNNDATKKSNPLSSISVDNYTLNELKQANYDLSRILSEINKSENPVKFDDIHKEQFSLQQFIKDVLLVIDLSSKEDKLDFIINKKIDKPYLIISDQIKLKQIFISLLFYFYNNSIRNVHFSFDINKNNKTIFNFNLKNLKKEFNIDISKTLIPTYIELIGAKYNITNNAISIVLNDKEIKKETKDYSITFNKEYVLIIDDDNENLSYIEYVIKNFNANILKATDGIEAINLFKEYNERIEIVIMDVNMPGLNGNDAAKYMKEINPKVPILLVTAYLHYKNYINNGDKLLLKPFTPKVLVENISELVN